MKKYIYLGIYVLVLGLGLNEVVFAQDWRPVQQVNPETYRDIFGSYKDYARLPTLTFPVPTVVEASFSTNVVYSDVFAVYDQTRGQFIPNLSVHKEQLVVVPVNAIETNINKNLMSLFDENYTTTVDFYLNSDIGSATILIDFASAIKSSSFTLDLDNYVSLPTSITVKAVVDGSEIVVLNKLRPNSRTITFPETVSGQWNIQLEYAQPLRISEIRFSNTFNTISKRSVRFIAVPNSQYLIYANPEVMIQSPENYGERPDFLASEDVKNIGTPTITSNPSFVLSDIDKDTVPDIRDNCVNVSNQNQEDLDTNGKGDMCEDFDRDGILNSTDNCKNVSNYNQLDTDGDTIGDTCDPDESRLTEKYPAIVWGGIGIAFSVFLGLLFVAGNKIRKNSQQKLQDNNKNPQI